MSALEKASQGDLLDYHTSALHDPSAYASFTQPPYATHLLYPSALPEDNDQLHYMTSSDFSVQHDPYDENRSSYLDPRLRHIPEITSYTPREGPQDSRVIVMEGGTGSSAPQAVEVGAFTHLGPLSQSTSHDLSRKRKLSSSSEEALLNVKRHGTNARSSVSDTEHAFSTTTASPYSPFLPTPTGNTLFQGRYQAASPRSFGHQYTTSSASQASLTAPSPHTPSFSPSFAPVNKVARSPAVSVTPAARASNASSPGESTPVLVRTSTIQPSSGAVPMGATPATSFNPYAMYPHKATLKLNGDLDAMAENWKLEEWEAKRRLVQFTRRQKESTIVADFKAIAPEERQPNSICISCIWWEEKKECFVTSVDTIHLLESLVAVRFTVEEKNRIRRNLEGFRPLTVSKAKADSDEFFKIIMGFPNPKPRNIEKDVKVFPWKILAHALKKIIGKYSASYSSTAGALSTPSSYAGASDDSPESHLSPRSGSISVPVPTSYAQNVATFAPPRGQISRMPSISGAHIPTASLAYPTPSTYSYQSQTPTQPMSAPPLRQSASWDFAPFINQNAPASAPANIQTYNYNRTVPPVTYTSGYPTTRG